MTIQQRLQAIAWARGTPDAGSDWKKGADVILEWVDGSAIRWACLEAAFRQAPSKKLHKVLDVAEKFATYAESDTVAKVPQGDPPRKPGRPKGSTNKK